MALPQRRVRRKVRWDRVFVLLLLLMLALASLAGAAVYAYINMTQPSAAAPSKVAAVPQQTQEVLNKRTNILLLGVDETNPDFPGDTSRRSDTMLVASVDPESCALNILSLPRDTRVPIPGRKEPEKIAHAHAHGGPELARQTVEQYLQIPIAYYVTIDWQAFIKVIDILGGVDLYVENKMNYEDEYAGLKINLEQGYQHLDGEKGGEYVRFRSDELGDIGRVQRQQRFLKALTKEVFQVGTILKLPALMSTINQYVHTDMTLYTMIKLANSLKTFKPEQLTTEMLPGKFATIGGLSYWLADDGQTKEIVDRLFFLDKGKVADGSVSGAAGTNGENVNNATAAHNAANGAGNKINGGSNR